MKTNHHRLTALLVLSSVSFSLSSPTRAGDQTHSIRERGQLNCGVDWEGNELNSFGTSRQWTGFDIDFYNAIAIAVLGDGGSCNTDASIPKQLVQSVTTGQRDLVMSDRDLPATQNVILGPPILAYGDRPRVPVLIGQKWSDVVSAVIHAIVSAERFNITSANVKTLANGNAQAKPFFDKANEVGLKVGLSQGWAVRANPAVGNYDEIFRRRFGEKRFRSDNKSQLIGGRLEGFWNIKKAADVQQVLVGTWKFDTEETTKAFQEAAKVLGGLPPETVNQVKEMFNNLAAQDSDELKQGGFTVTKSSDGTLTIQDGDGEYQIEVVNANRFQINVEELFFPLVMKRIAIQ